MGRIGAAGYYGMDWLIDAPHAERAQLFKILAEGRAGWARLLRKVPGAEAPAADVEIRKAAHYEAVDIFAAIRADKALGGIGDILRPRQEDVVTPSEASCGGNRARPP